MLITDYYVTKKHSIVLLAYKEKIAELDEEIWFYNKEKIKLNFDNDDDFINELALKSQFVFARKKALKFLARRSYSVEELRKKLKEGFSEEAVDLVIQRMKELDFLDDEKYARNLAQNLSQNKCMSPKAIKYELIAKGIEREIVDEILCEFEYNSDDKIRKIIKKKYSNQLNTEKGLRRTYNAILRLGYSYEDAKKVITEFTEDL